MSHSATSAFPKAYANGGFLGSDTSTPFSFVWTNPPAGTHSLTALATDSAGGTITSNAIALSVATTRSIGAAALAATPFARWAAARVSSTAHLST